MRSGMLQAVVYALVFFASALWAFELGYRVAGAWLGLLMGLNSGVFAVMLVSSLPHTLRRLNANRLGMRRADRQAHP